VDYCCGGSITVNISMLYLFHCMDEKTEKRFVLMMVHSRQCSYTEKPTTVDVVSQVKFQSQINHVYLCVPSN
jgi:hypothetical protein